MEDCLINPSGSPRETSSYLTASSANIASLLEGIQAAKRKKTKCKPKGQNKKVFVGGLTSRITKNDIWTHFSAFGKVSFVNMMKNKATKAKRGFCFVTFSNKDCAALAAHYQFHSINNTKVEVKMALSKESIKEAKITGSRLTAAQKYAKLNKFNFFNYKLGGGEPGYEYFSPIIDYLETL